MTATLLAQPLRRPFVGRSAEEAILVSALAAGPENTLFRVSGPTGIGKTALLVRLSQEARKRQVPLRWLDAGHFASDSDVVAIAHLESMLDLLARSVAEGARHVLVIDDVHRVRPVERWLAFRLFDLPPGLSVVIGDRQPPGALWLDARAAGAHELRLEPLAALDVDAYLDARQVERDGRAGAVAFAEGNPLLLTIACDALDPARATDETTALLNVATSLCDVGVEQRLGFAIAIVAKSTPRELLEATLSDSAARAVFQWLCSLSLFDETTTGLRPHPVVRRAFALSLRAHQPSILQEAQAAVVLFARQQAIRGEPADRRVAGAELERGPLRSDVAQRLMAEVDTELEAPDPEFREQLRRRLDELARTSRLTDRELEVFELLVLGRNAPEIGLALGITPRTAKFHQQRVLEKIGADTRYDILRLLL